MAFDRNRKDSRPPVEGPLRRLPGQSLRDERDRLLNDQGSEYLILAIGSCFLAVWEWLRRWFPSLFTPQLMTASAVIMTGYCAFRLLRVRREIRNLNQAEKGERRVSEVLRTLRDKDYVTFDDLLLGNVNIDHVVVGPGGIFALETKAYSIFGSGVAGIAADGLLYLSTKPALGDPMKQARRSGALVSAEVKRWMQRELWVAPVLVLPGWRIDPPKTETKIVVTNEETLTEFFRSRERVLSNEQIREICSHLDRSARS